MQPRQTVAPGSSVTAMPSDFGPDEPATCGVPAAPAACISCCTVRRSCPSPEISRRRAVPNLGKSAWESACKQACRRRCARASGHPSAAAPASGATATSPPNAKRSGVPKTTANALAMRAPPNAAHSQYRQRDGRTMTDTAQFIQWGKHDWLARRASCGRLPPAPEHHRCRTTSGQCTGLQKAPIPLDRDGAGQVQIFAKTSVPLVPPKPNEFFTA